MFLVRRLLLCEELERSSCGSVLFHGYLPPPGTYALFIELFKSFYHYIKYKCVNRKICFLIISFVNLLEKMKTLILTEVRSDYKVG